MGSAEIVKPSTSPSDPPAGLAPGRPGVSKRRRDLSKVSDLEFARALSFGCAYCGRSKDDAPPLWCVRSHEGWEAAQRELSQRTGR